MTQGEPNQARNKLLADFGLIHVAVKRLMLLSLFPHFLKVKEPGRGLQTCDMIADGQ